MKRSPLDSVAAALLLAACSDSACPSPDGGPPPADAAELDSGGGDAGPSVDAGADAGPVGGDAGPSDAGPTAYALEGLWRVESFSTVDSGGTVTTLTRDGSPASLRGDALIAAIGTDRLLLDSRMIQLQDGLIASPILTVQQEVDLEGDRWAIRDQNGNTDVFLFARAGDLLTLTWDDSDPRNDSPGGHVTEFQLQLVPPMRQAYGDWDLVSMTVGGTMVTAGACAAFGTGAWAELQQQIVVDFRYIITQQTTIDTFSDDTCSTSVNTQTQQQSAYAEEDGDVLTVYVPASTGTAYTLTFSMASAGNQLTLTRTSCLPEPACDSNQPTEVVLQRRRL